MEKGGGCIQRQEGVLEVNNRRTINFFQLDHVEPFSKIQNTFHLIKET